MQDIFLRQTYGLFKCPRYMSTCCLHHHVHITKTVSLSLRCLQKAKAKIRASVRERVKNQQEDKEWNEGHYSGHPFERRWSHGNKKHYEKLKGKFSLLTFLGVSTEGMSQRVQNLTVSGMLLDTQPPQVSHKTPGPGARKASERRILHYEAEGNSMAE